MTDRLAPILRTPWALVPPYESRDRSLLRQPGESADQAHSRLVARKVAVLLEPLDGVPLSDYERRVLSWVACWETHTVAVLAALLRRARARVSLAIMPCAARAAPPASRNPCAASRAKTPVRPRSGTPPGAPGCGRGVAAAYAANPSVTAL